MIRYEFWQDWFNEYQGVHFTTFPLTSYVGSQILFHCNVTTVRGRVSAVFWPQLVPQWDSSNSLHSPLWLGAVTLLASDWSVSPLLASHWLMLWLVCSVLWSGSGSGQEINGESQLWMSSEKDEGELVYIQFGLILTVTSARGCTPTL